MGWRGALLGSGGCLNGVGTPAGGTPTRDAYHGDEPDHWFHPTLIVDKSDDEVRADIRAFSQSYVGGFRWQWWWLRQPAENCRTFQEEMFDAVGLFEESDVLYTRGSGCPFMYPFRQVKWRTIDALASALGRVRSWPGRVGRRSGLRFDTGLDGPPPGADRQPGAPLALTDAKARARARVRGALLPCRSEGGDAPGQDERRD
ncbi:MAG: hypothetical protein M3401_18380 [Actinomycetota bacterium]|nr:hypothetical protein [Actinomycetota bacterium]